MNNRKSLTLLCAIMLLPICASASPRKVSFTTEELSDKIMGGWAGQTFGCAYGGPTEFKFNGQIIPDSVAVSWDGEHRCRWYFDNEPGIYDDVYMDLSFLEVIGRYGMNCPVDRFAKSFAFASYKLWHANQAARYNILAGMKAPECGHWHNNPHADDIDFQIEADFAGLISPALPACAMEVCDKVGHIMNYGDGYYGGLYVATMYSNAFVYDDISLIVKKSLEAIPSKSEFHKCISDVIRWCSENKDWRVTWEKVNSKWTDEISCPKGVDDPFNIDAKLNAAYVVMGLLYGGMDMDRTVEISMRCGADSDCNPATAAGILGTVLGYKAIPARWTDDIEEVRSIVFPHTKLSLDKALEMTVSIAQGNVIAAGGKIKDGKISIPVQKVVPAKYEKSFEGLRLVGKDKTRYNQFRKPFHYEFDGCGVVFAGKLNRRKNMEAPNNYVARITLDVDGVRQEDIVMPLRFIKRKFDIYWNYLLPQGHHTVDMIWNNPIPEVNLVLESTVVYEKQ